MLYPNYTPTKGQLTFREGKSTAGSDRFGSCRVRIRRPPLGSPLPLPVSRSSFPSPRSPLSNRGRSLPQTNPGDESLRMKKQNGCRRKTDTAVVPLTRERQKKVAEETSSCRRFSPSVTVLSPSCRPHQSTLPTLRRPRGVRGGQGIVKKRENCLGFARTAIL